MRQKTPPQAEPFSQYIYDAEFRSVCEMPQHCKKAEEIHDFFRLRFFAKTGPRFGK